MKAVFPTSARDVVTIGYTTQLEDGRMIMANKSIEHGLCPEKPGIVRIETGCAGVVVEPIEGQPNKCFVTQIADANPKGWIPKSVITLCKRWNIACIFNFIYFFFLKKKFINPTLFFSINKGYASLN